jgi:5-methylcytosine-specific restriction endonuclease McrA
MKKYGHLNDTKLISGKCRNCLKEFTYEVPIGRSSKKDFCSSSCHSQHLISNKPLCSFEGCSKLAKNLSGGLCPMHHTRMRNHGDPSVLLKIAKHEDGIKCKVDECTGDARFKDYCSKHYQMWRKHGDPKGGRYEYTIRKAVTHSDGTRTCSQCNERLPISDFHKDKAATDGLRSKCKKCRISNVKSWYSDNRERQSTKERIRRQANPEKYAEKEAIRYEKDKDKRLLLATEHSHLRKARKKKAKTERGISKLSLKKIFGTKCYYCGIEMDFSTGSGRKFNRSMATIEHLIPLAKGGEHTFENTVLACRHCNISKNSKTEEEFEEFKKKK